MKQNGIQTAAVIMFILMMMIFSAAEPSTNSVITNTSTQEVVWPTPVPNTQKVNQSNDCEITAIVAINNCNQAVELATPIVAYEESK